MADYKKLRPRCFFDIKIGDKDVGRITFELFNDICPITCENFKALCTGERGIGKLTQKPLHYKDVIVHRVVKNFIIQGGDFSMGNGRGGESIYGGTFKDENFDVKHDKPFLLSMANRGKNTNGSQFFITTKPAPHLDGVHVVFGHVISGQEVVSEIENQPTDGNCKPLIDIKISNCGELIPQIKPKDKKKRKREKKSEGEISSDEEDRKAKKKKKKEKKHKKHKKNKDDSKKADKKDEKEDPEQFHSSIKPEEIPEIPPNKFLFRKTESDTEKEKVLATKSDETNASKSENYDKFENDSRQFQNRRYIPVSRSGRKIKGRGMLRYRTPTPDHQRSGSETPPHWRNAQSRIKPFKEIVKSISKKKDEGDLKEKFLGRDKSENNFRSPRNYRSYYSESYQERSIPRRESRFDRVEQFKCYSSD